MTFFNDYFNNEEIFWRWLGFSYSQDNYFEVKFREIRELK